LIPGGTLAGNTYFKQKNETNLVEEGEKSQNPTSLNKKGSDFDL
jgi:hypothetical protein